ncbi:MAG: hypothetical protein JWM81_757 [Candidatus Saccharibacteria bacterium]|nr:hypothetical protein [Candidatus Saccharibacteria bacterium]
MYQALLDSLSEWNAVKTDRQKLQSAYLVLIVAAIFVAGIISLLNADFSRQAVYAVFILVTAFVTNFVAWSLLRTTLLDKLDARAPQPRPTAARTVRRSSSK